MLRDNEFIMALQENPAQSLPPDCKKVLTGVASAFIPDISELPRKKSKASDGSSSQTARDKGVGGGGKKNAKSPFVTILRLQELALSPVVQAHLDTNKTDAQSFFYSKELVNNVQNYSKDSTGEAMIIQYQYTKTVSRQLGLNSIRWLFLMLMWHDLVKLARPDCTGNRIGHLMKVHLLELIKPVYASSSDMQKLAIEEVADELHAWCKFGAKINILVENFGEGCVFYLHNILSPNFLSDKMTASGGYYVEAITYLQDSLHITKLLDDNPPVVTLGRNIRRYLVQPFRESKKQM
ncbi:uncharacterized protein J4E92_008621 [Alternaria infectoria]|uniref:uncharacterized protein n=1 Tax=Alternaria viburni TaxID=566460 RepID=UPI0020C2891B|nr:uncharacterized protein J4E79_000928 [Alternaria viburni]XP_051349670.1 uncharacterized protein J4E92_008621 [Alternaria infectoria]KAI4668886.1 hypothetical protein J4E79_000928 [Alternaria viburni]KAI4918977.1 hypothetical protein J4E92_008621 [Alternaria infectoria]